MRNREPKKTERTRSAVEDPAKARLGSEIIAGLSEFAEALKKGDEQQRFTSRRIRLNLEPSRYTPGLVKKTRRTLGLSQALFARFLGVSVGTVRNWEQGVNKAPSMARRFMDEIRNDPRYWLDRFESAAVAK